MSDPTDVGWRQGFDTVSDAINLFSPSPDARPGVWAGPSSNLIAVAPYFIDITMPLSAGRRFYGLLARMVLTARTGVAVGNLTYQYSQNGVDVSATGNLLNAANLNSGNPSATPTTLSINFGYLDAISMTSHPLQLHVTGIPTGVTVLTGFPLVTGFYL